MTERPLAADLKGRNTSEDSFAGLTANSVVAYAVDFQPDLLSGFASGPPVWPESFGGLLWSLPGTDRIRLEKVSGSVLYEKV